MIGDLALLLAALALFAWRMRAEVAPPDQVARYRRSMARSLLAFGAGGIVLLALSASLGALAALPAEFAPAAALLDRWMGPSDRDALGLALGAGFAAGVVVSSALAWMRWRRGKRDWVMGDIRHLQPQAARAFGWAGLLAVVAAATEELFFRLALPLLVARITGDAWIGLATAVALFAFAHRYQRWAGVVGTALGGAFLTLVYLRAGTIALPIAAHAAINLQSLVLRPWLARRFSS